MYSKGLVLSYLDNTGIICNKYLDVFERFKNIYVVSRPKYFMSLVYPTLKRDYAGIPILK